jgi:Xaa-Pro dipeptidase
MNRRQFLGLTAAGTGTAALPQAERRRTDMAAQAAEAPEAIRRLRPMTAGIAPISDEERRGRMEKARRLMAESKIGAVILEPGSSLSYFTGIRWGSSERPFAVVLPARGEPAYIVPAFEEPRAREQIRFGNDLRAWEEDESPYRKLLEVLRDRGVGAGTVAFEERVRFFVFDGVRKESRGLTFVSADPVTAGCRMLKSAAEIALIERATDITVAAFGAAFSTLREGTTPQELRANCSAAFRACGADGYALIAMGKYTAYPHGSTQPQKLKEGELVLIDGGSSVEGYQSDVTRTVIFGKPAARQLEIWELERKTQDAVLAAARPGATCESLDAAARKVIAGAGLGPGYKLPGIPHRTGHGIGLDGHEAPYILRGNKTRLEPGMCFSDEPTIVIPEQFGIRLEDCIYMTEDGPRLFSAQSPAIDRPFA